jgi:hypothetical protein
MHRSGSFLCEIYYAHKFASKKPLATSAASDVSLTMPSNFPHRARSCGACGVSQYFTLFPPTRAIPRENARISSQKISAEPACTTKGVRVAYGCCKGDIYPSMAGDASAAEGEYASNPHASICQGTRSVLFFALRLYAATAAGVIFTHGDQAMAPRGLGKSTPPILA